MSGLWSRRDCRSDARIREIKKRSGTVRHPLHQVRMPENVFVIVQARGKRDLFFD